MLERALAVLAEGGVVGIPTETVYGLAARLDRPHGLERIFTIKQRPFFDPLIVHVCDVSMAKQYVQEWPQLCDVLATKFWPGPLSLVLKKNSQVPDIVTADLDTVALRVPQNPMTLALIKACGVGLAAPSANRFGRTSPTQGAHVEQEFGGQVFVLHGEPSGVGVESTVLWIDGQTLSILRPGFVTRSQIEEVLQQARIDFVWEDSSTEQADGAHVPRRSPGSTAAHYAPALPLMWIGPDAIDRAVEQKRAELGGRPVRLELSQEPQLVARELYSQLRRLSETGASHIEFHLRGDMTGELWSVILDRLSRASRVKL